MWLIAFLGILILSACSNAGKNETVIIDEETGEEIVVTQEEIEQREKEIKAYSEHLSNTFDTSMELQDTFARALDNLFTKESSPNQFANILKQQIIEKSREVLDVAEKYNFPVEYFELNQMVVANLNNQHQLFLDAVNEAVIAAETGGDIEMNIVDLRERLALLKQEYLSIVNTWKNGGKTSD